MSSHLEDVAILNVELPQQLKCEFPSIANLVKSQVNIKCSSGSVHALSIR